MLIKILFKQRLQELYITKEIIIGQAIIVDSILRSYLRDKGVSASDVLNTLRYYIGKGYLEPYNPRRPDDIEMVAITPKGADWLDDDDVINSALQQIGSNLVDMRKGMLVALNNDGNPDNWRQAASSARELLSQTLKEGAPGLETRKERAKHLMGKNLGKISKTDIKIIDASCELIEAEHEKMSNLTHSRGKDLQESARSSVEAAERVLRLLFKK